MIARPRHRRLAAWLLAVVLTLGLMLRLNEARRRDLYNDEAIAATIARSFREDGTLSNLRYSSFLPPEQYRDGVWAYHPPLFPILQSALPGIDGAGNLAPRLLVVFANLAALLLLPVLSVAAGWGPQVGWIAAASAALSAFHLHSSVTALSYSLVGPVLTAALVALARGLSRNRRRDWLLLILTALVGYSIHPLSLLSVGFLFAGIAWATASGAHRTAASAIASMSAILLGVVPWLWWSSGHSTTIGNFLSRAPDYTFAAQARLVAGLYDAMLPGVVLKAGFAIGIATAVRNSVHGRAPVGGLLVLWAMTPLLYLASRNLFLTPRHVAFALPAILMVSTRGCLLSVRAMFASSGTRSRAAGFAARGGAVWLTAAVLTTAQLAALASPDAGAPASVLQVVRSGDAALEFGGPDVVSRFCALLRERRQGEPIIAPVGLSESWYLSTYVHDRRTPQATAEAWRLIRSGPAWVFVGDNFLRNGALDDFDRFVIANGQLMMSAPPVDQFTDPANRLGYALFRIDLGSPGH